MNVEPRPLRDRVDAPASLPLPDGPEGCTWRTLVREDAAVLADLAERISARDHPSWSESRDELHEQLSHSWVDPSRDGVLCLDVDSRPIAYGLVSQPPDPESLVRVFVSGGVDPLHRGRGLGHRMLTWQHTRARQLLRGSSHSLPAWVMTHAADLAPEHGALLLRHGFEVARYFTTLECAAPASAANPVTPRGVSVERYQSQWSEEVRQAKNSAFADHWGSQPIGQEQWRSMEALPSFRPELSRVALDGNRVVGFVMTEINEDDWVKQGYSSGYIGLVGTVSEWRRRGLATALLGEVLRAYREAGLDRAVLDVDTESPTGALGLYTALGFTPTTRDAAYRVLY